MHRRTNRPTHVIPKLSVLLVVMLLVLTLAQLAQAAGNGVAVIRLHDQVGTRGGEVRLAEIAELQGDYAQSFANLKVATIAPASGRSGQTHRVCGRVTLKEVRRRLQMANAHFGKLSLRGYTVCELRALPTAALQNDAEQVTGAPAAAVIANPERQTLTLQTPVTLHERVVSMLRRNLVAQTHKPDPRRATPRGEEWVVTFSEADRTRLNRSALDAQYALTPMSNVGLGRVTVRIGKVEKGVTREAFNVSATVQRKTLGVVTTRTLRRGEIFTATDLAIEEVLLTKPHANPLARTDLIVGQVAGTLLREGAVVFPEYVKAPALVKRGDIVTVQCVVGGLMIRTSVRATEDGALDDTITVCNEASPSREKYTVRVTGKRQATLEETPAVATR